jgi:hypothetical protein
MAIEAYLGPTTRGFVKCVPHGKQCLGIGIDLNRRRILRIKERNRT